VLFVEEPLPSQALAGLRILKKSSSVSLAMGEHVQDLSHLVTLMSGGVANVVQPDLAMIGGLTPVFDLALIAEALDVVVSPHFLAGLFAHVAAVSMSVRWLKEFPCSNHYSMDGRQYLPMAIWRRQIALATDWDFHNQRDRFLESDDRTKSSVVSPPHCILHCD
jgi:L-alanine-DL-glutamate epimerase-like enolase superfamily enzyme